MFCQQSVISDAMSGLSISKVPIGNNLSGPNPSLPKIDGSIALDFSSQQLYYVGGNVWKTFTGFALSLSPVGVVPNANAATITGAVLNLQPASAAFPGVVTTGAQSFNGTKTFSAIIAPGTNYITANPAIGSVANDGLTIDNVANTVTLEFADATHNGIVSTAAQSFNGTKTFTAIIAPGTNYITANPVVGSVANDGLTIDNVANTVALEFADATHNGIVSTGAQTYGGTKTFSAIIAPGTNYAAVAPIVATDNNSLTINNVTNQIAAEIADATHNGIVTTATQAFGGIKQFEDGVQMLNLAPVYASVLNTPTYFEQDSVALGTLGNLNLTGDGGINVVNPLWHVQKCGRIVFLAIGSSGPVTLSAPGVLMTCPAGTIPVTYRPLSVFPRRAYCILVENGANAPGFIEIYPDGSLIFALNAPMSLGFTGVCGTADTTITYTI